MSGRETFWPIGRRSRRQVRRIMLAAAAVAICLWAGLSLWPTSRVLVAARRSVPGIIIQSVLAEDFNGNPAWEVHGIDSDGTEWLLDISPNGEVLMKEPVGHGLPRSVVMPSSL
jgi:hypothetical protein